MAVTRVFSDAAEEIDVGMAYHLGSFTNIVFNEWFA
jgi:hypothetical protein